ncbi:hypothetical protein K4K56_007952 [Colletotrichum sp. SAR 10_98]|nr:hypothetical protein K4K56_007952 [Colletotrichum sp. SAR 10_98]
MRHADSSSTSEKIETSTEKSSQDVFPARPPSTKSRNASQSRNHERSSSSLSMRDQADVISQQLETISRRAESHSRTRSRSEEVDETQPDRPSSPKSRNCSRGRPSEHLSSILIAASPSILSDKNSSRPSSETRPAQQATPERSLSRMGFRARAGSASETDRHVRSKSRTSISGEQLIARPSSRATSRGRQPGPVFSPPKMVPHDPSQSVDDAREASLLRKKDRRRSLSTKEPITSPASEPTYARVESVVNLTCPLHGRNSTSSAPSGHRVSSTLASGRSKSTSAAVANNESTEPVVNGSVADNPLFSAIASSGPTDASSLSETIETISAASRSPSTPLFEPKTPKAMVLIRDVDDVGAGVPPLLDLSDSLPDLTCIERKVAPVSDAPQAIVA